MEFDNWLQDINTDAEQKKRYEKAQKVDLTPLSIDKEAGLAYFSGSRKKPYETTLNECTCKDFALRQLPCKHMYRLALELGYLDGDFKGDKNYINKNMINDYIFTFSPEAQEFLFGLCHPSGDTECIANKSSYVQELVDKNFCTTRYVTKEDITSYPLRSIKRFIYSLKFDNAPSLHANTKNVYAWLDDNEDEFFKLINKEYYLVRLSDGVAKLKNTIYRRYYSRFERGIDEYGFEVVKHVFIQEEKYI